MYSYIEETTGFTVKARRAWNEDGARERAFLHTRHTTRHTRHTHSHPLFLYTLPASTHCFCTLSLHPPSNAARSLTHHCNANLSAFSFICCTFADTLHHSTTATLQHCCTTAPQLHSTTSSFQLSLDPRLLAEPDASKASCRLPAVRRAPLCSIAPRKLSTLVFKESRTARLHRPLIFPPPTY